MSYCRSILVIFLFLVLGSTYALNIEGWNYGDILIDEYDNTPPDPPSIEGPTTCNITEKIHYNITITDPDGDRLVELNVLFGDEKNETITYRGSSCTKGWRSGMTLTITHRWRKQDDYTIKARVKDYSRDWGEWGFLDVHVAHDHPDHRESLFSIFFDILIDRHIDFPSLIIPYGQ
jgi:hypothetical protein